MMTETERYWAKIAIRARDGDSECQRRILRSQRSLGVCPNEVFEFFMLNMDLGIFSGSSEHRRLSELTAKYEVNEVLATQVE